jgi:hypothetical protein
LHLPGCMRTVWQTRLQVNWLWNVYGDNGHV